MICSLESSTIIGLLAACNKRPFSYSVFREMEIKCAKANKESSILRLERRRRRRRERSSVLNEEELSCQLSLMYSTAWYAMVVGGKSGYS